LDAQGLISDWGWGFTKPQPLPNPKLSLAKGNYQQAIQKKETEVSNRITNFVLLCTNNYPESKDTQYIWEYKKKKVILLLLGR
jgi:uncharacterized protein YcnI